MTKYTYGAMSSKFSVMAENKLTAYAAMVYHFDTQAHMIALYEPEETKNDSWLNITGQISERLDQVFGGSFEKYVDEHIEELKAAFVTIKRLI